MQETAKVSDSCSAAVSRVADQFNELTASGRFYVTCRDKNGSFRWRDTIDNVITTVGKNDIVNKYFAGAAYTQTFRMGLKGAGSAVAGDTQASHAGWLEVGGANAPAYTGNRKDVVMGAAAAGVSTSAVQVFDITSSGTVAGCFTNNGGSATKDDTGGTLVSSGNFSGGDKVVAATDSVSVTYAFTLS